MFDLVKNDGLEYFSAPDIQSGLGVTVIFTGRRGGQSLGPYSALNLSFNVGDDRQAVTSNRARLSRSLGTNMDSWVTCQQVHGAKVIKVEEQDRGRGSRDHWSGLPRTDGMVSDSRDIAIGILTADCAPVVLVAGNRPVVGIAHAGWKGVIAGVVPRTLEELSRTAGCGPSDVVALIGPRIGACCFSVGTGVARLFSNSFPGDTTVCRTGKSGLITVDVGEACRNQLTRAGVQPGNIFSTGICTSCDEDYFSFRRSGGVTGRQLTMAIPGG